MAAQRGFPDDLSDAGFMKATGLGSLVFAIKPGDGSAREQAASCQRVLGGDANVAREYATKRYRSNLINWGIIPFIVDEQDQDRLDVGDLLLIRGIRTAVISNADRIEAEIRRGDTHEKITLLLANLSEAERRILLSGCLINFYGEENV